MAQIHGASGTIGGLPIRGGSISLSDTDVKVAVASMAGLARSLAVVAGGLALAAAAVAVFANLRAGSGQYGWQQLASVRTHSRQFNGVCLNAEINISVEGHDLSIPINYIKEYSTYVDVIDKGGWFRDRIVDDRGVKLRLFDGSLYKGIQKNLNDYKFITPLGLQIVKRKEFHMIRGSSVGEVDRLSNNINMFLKHERNSVERIIGEEAFQRFFISS